jgi:hypothetical protein
MSNRNFQAHRTAPEEEKEKEKNQPLLIQHNTHIL